jgi:hypothetical protein
MARVSVYTVGKQPCQDFLRGDSSSPYLEPGNRRNTHQCPVCEGRRAWCDNSLRAAQRFIIATLTTTNTAGKPARTKRTAPVRKAMIGQCSAGLNGLRLRERSNDQMKPPIEYRRKAPQKPKEPPAKPGGRWVWVPDGMAVETRDKASRRERMREYMRKRRAKDQS